MKGLMKNLTLWLMGAVAMLVVVMGSGCSSPAGGGSASAGSGTISGTLINGENVPVEIHTLRNGQFVRLGLTMTDDNGRFSLTPSENLPYDYHKLVVDNMHTAVLIMDSTMDVNITAELPFEGFLKNIEIEGSEATAVLSDYYNNCMHHQDTIREMTNLMNANKDPELAQKYSSTLISHQIAADKEARAFINEVIAGGGDADATLGALEHLKTQMGWTEYEKALKATENSLGGGEFHKALKKNLVANRKTAPRTLPGGNNGGAADREQPTMGRRPNPGDIAADIVMNGINGEERKLSDLRGKVVLIDFWASWCGPCRRENPNVVRAYERYKDAGFEVFSVSLDSNQDRWEKAIAQDGLVWENHVSDLRGWNNAAAKAYGVTSIPFTLLIDQEGQVIATNLRGSRLFAQLEQLLN